jgi:hypothetical protein
LRDGAVKPVFPGGTLDKGRFFFCSKKEFVMGLPEGYQRKGCVKTLQYDVDAWAMLVEIAPTEKSYGRFISELIRRDYIRRQEWQRVRAAVPELVEVGSA